MVITEVRDAVKLIRELVSDTRTILKTLEDGREYLQRHHPTATKDVAELLEQMRITVRGAISVTRIVSDFDFTVEGSDIDRQPARFNDHLIKADQEIALREGDIDLLRGSCNRIWGVQQALSERAGGSPWWALLGDKAGQRAGELSETMGRLYENDDAMVRQIEIVLQAGHSALQTVRDELGKDGGPSPANVRDAQKVIREQADAFAPLVNELKKLRDRLSNDISALDAPTP